MTINRQRILTTIVNVARLILGLTFILSGFVKAIDPHGTQYKFEDYLAALSLGGIFPDWILILASVSLSSFEFALGMLILVAIQPKLISRVTLAFMTFMTIVTIWIFIDNPVQDCGCFGDALALSNGETLLKNVFLLACAMCLTILSSSIKAYIPQGVRWFTLHIAVIALLILSFWCLYDLPIIDFRPYHIGADIVKGMEIPEGAERPEYLTTFILEKDGVQKEFTLEEYPDSTWTFIDSKTKVLKQGYQPPIHDFSITTSDGDDITDDILQYRGFTFLLISPTLAQADDSNFGDIDQLYEFAEDNGCRFYCLTASGDDDINRWIDITGAEYEFCQTDGTTLKTMIRSNPGVVLIKQGIIIGKWSHNRIPNLEKLKSLVS